jgi:hypothetical protein
VLGNLGSVAPIAPPLAVKPLLAGSAKRPGSGQLGASFCHCRHCWPDKAKQAALSLSGVENEEPSQNTLLLADIRDAFDATDDLYMRSSDLVAALVAMPERPWGECNHGKALTQNGLARRLKPFKVWTKDVGPEAKRNKGYLRESFADAFNRYLPPSSTAHPHTTMKSTSQTKINPRRRFFAARMEIDITN